MSKSVLYLECSSGISGDMTVAALLDLGADRRALDDALASLPLSGYSIEIKDVFKSGIRACDFHVVLEHDNHDHDMDYLHGHTHAAEGCAQDHAHGSHAHAHTADANSRTHTHGSQPHAHGHAHTARNLGDITELIRAARLTDGARDLALRIFGILAEAEATVHGKSVDEVHFHEVGAVDSIVDIVAAAVCLDNLQTDYVVVSPLTDGGGQIRCQHGVIPVPVPAVTAIAARHNLILKHIDIEGELVTPTGAAIAAALRSDRKLPDAFRIARVGCGAGKRAYATAGLLRAMLLEPAEDTVPDLAAASSVQPGTPLPAVSQEASDPAVCGDAILSLETNIDDCTGEALAFTMQELLHHGALDVFYTPIYMKKNRPAYLLRALCRIEDRAALESIIFKNTTTIGIRVQQMQRTRLPRRVLTLQTPWGTADVKCCMHDGATEYYPENDSISRLAHQNGIGFPEMYRMIQTYACQTLTGSGGGSAVDI